MILPVLNAHAAKGADSPDIAPLLAAREAPDAKPYARPPRQVATEQRKHLFRYLVEFLDKGWI